MMYLKRNYIALLSLGVIMPMLLTSCHADEPEQQPPSSGETISVKTHLTVQEVNSRSVQFPEADKLPDIEKKLENVWLIAARINGTDTTIVKTAMTRESDYYTCSIDKKTLSCDKCLFYYVGNADLIENLSSISTLKALRNARMTPASTQSGIRERYVMATQAGIIPIEKEGAIVSTVSLSTVASRFKVHCLNTLRPIERITISGTSQYGNLHSFFDGKPGKKATEESFILIDEAVGMGGSEGKTGIGYYYLYPADATPVTVRVEMGGQTQNLSFTSIEPNGSYNIVVRCNVLLAFSSDAPVDYQNDQFETTADEINLQLTCMEGAELTTNTSWINIENSMPRTSDNEITTVTRTLRCQANPNGQERTGTFTARCNGVEEIFTIVQRGDASNPAGIEYVAIPSGSFMMGSPVSEKNRDEDETQHFVTLSKGFSISKYEVTNEQFCKFLNAKNIGADGYWKESPNMNKRIISTDRTQSLQYSNGRWTPASGQEKFPVVYVTWFGASSFASWAGGSLPTEAQWEYAARGNYPNKAAEKATKPFGIGSGYELNQTLANFYWKYAYRMQDGEYVAPNAMSKSAVQVGSYTEAANNYGLYDMHGNVWEWCSDFYDPGYGNAIPDNPATNPTGADSGTERVVKGGSWYFYARCCRSAFRMHTKEDTASHNIGFRIVRL